MQNREELRQKGHDGSRKTMCCKGEKNNIFRRGGGINIVLGPKYRPLREYPKVACCTEERKSASLFLSCRNANLGFQNRNCTLCALNF
jgi:hypothetical protein